MGQYKTGKRPARKGAIKFGFADYFDVKKLPVPPPRFGHENIGKPWGMLANDEHSCCVFSGAAHEHMVWTHEGGLPVADFEDANVLADYSAVTGFQLGDEDTDQGTDMAAAASYRRRVGIVDAKGVRRKIAGYVSLKPGDVDQLIAATYLTGAVGVGLNLPKGAMDEFDAHKPWDVHHGKSHGTEGGHYVTCIGRNSAGMLLIVTWGAFHAMSPAFYQQWSDEAVLYYSPEIIRPDKKTPEGFDEPTLLSHLGQLGYKSKPGA